MTTVILYLIGKPGTGKYSIAKEISKYGYTICDNQLINNPIFALLNYDGLATTIIPGYAWDAITKIRNSVFDFLNHKTYGDYVLTNVLNEDAGDRALFAQVMKMASDRGSLFIPVKLLISEEENIKRIQNPDRLSRYKSTDTADIATQTPLLHISHPNLLELDVTTLSTRQAARIILTHVAQ